MSALAEWLAAVKQRIAGALLHSSNSTGGVFAVTVLICWFLFWVTRDCGHCGLANADRRTETGSCASCGYNSNYHPDRTDRGVASLRRRRGRALQQQS